jgi:uncharacterized membrane protein HdeD (DUF308 family)
MFTCGIIILINPFIIAVAIVKVLGLLISIYAVIDLIETLSLKQYIKKI